MGLSQITEFAIKYFFGRIVRRLFGFALVVLFALIAVYHFTIAGMLALETQFAPLYARLIVAAIYTGATLILLIVLMATRVKPPITGRTTAARKSSYTMQILMFIEDVMLAYSSVRKSGRRKS